MDEPGLDDLFGVGVICSVRQMMRIPGSENMRVVAEGDGRGALMAFVRTKPFLSAVVQPLDNRRISWIRIGPMPIAVR